jgi:hypothetical protein
MDQRIPLECCHFDTGIMGCVAMILIVIEMCWDRIWTY